jgi:hypothetical protein
MISVLGLHSKGFIQNDIGRAGFVVIIIGYGNMGCQVFKGGMQN